MRMQERLWKRTAAKVFASAAAAAARKGGLKRTPLGEQLRKDAAQAAARVRFPDSARLSCVRLTTPWF